MCGRPGDAKRVPPEKEIRYLDQLVRGVYARRDLPKGHVLTPDDVFFAIPLLHGQISTREFTTGERLRTCLARNDPVLIRGLAVPLCRRPHRSENPRNTRRLPPRTRNSRGPPAGLQRIEVGRMSSNRS